MWSDQKVNGILQVLRSDDPRSVVHALNAIAADPPSDSRLLDVVDLALSDERPTVVSIPYRFGEVRSVAAHAALALRTRLGLPAPGPTIVHRSMTSNEVISTFTNLGLPSPVGLEPLATTIEEYRILCELGHVPTRVVP